MGSKKRESNKRKVNDWKIEESHKVNIWGVKKEKVIKEK